MTICYLDPEDEITGAVARLRGVSDGEAVLVLPPGSRIATSRINFRLLAREAEQNGLLLVAVSDEPGVRALAISAGLPAYDSIAAAESGLAEFRRQEQRLAERLGREPAAPAAQPAASRLRPVDDSLPGMTRSPAGRKAETDEGQRSPEATRVMPIPGREVDAGRAAPPVRPGADDAVVEGYRRRRATRRRWSITPLITILLVLALVAVGAYGAYVLIPTATITIRPNVDPVGPVSAAVSADPRVAVVDANEGVVPAQELQLPLTASGEFNASGTRVTTTRATGSVRFTSHNTAVAVTIPAGTRVSTGSGIAFETTAQVTVPRAVFGGAAGEADVAIRAVRSGVRGNVPAGAIDQVPDELGELIFVTNPQPTSGGERREARVVTGDDYAAAFAALSLELDGRLAAALADPATPPRGLTLYPDSARGGELTAQPPQHEVVGTAAERFALTISATATALAVNEAHVDQVVFEQLRALVPPGSTLLEASVEVSHTPGEYTGAEISYTASANGSAYRTPDRDALVNEIRGLPVAEAREIISRYGVAELTVWPDFVDRVPDQPARINLTILPPTEGT